VPRLSPTNLIALHVLNGFRREHRKASAHEITFFRICASSSPTTRKTAIRVRLSNGSVSVTRPKSSVSFRKARAHRSIPFKTGDSGNNNDFAIVQYGASCGLFTIAHKATAQGISKGEMMSLNKSVQRSASIAARKIVGESRQLKRRTVLMAFLGPASPGLPCRMLSSEPLRDARVQSGVYNDRRRCRTCSPAGVGLQDACTRKRRYLSYTSTRKNFRHTGRISEWLAGTSDIALSYRQFLCEFIKASPRRDFGRFSNSPPTGHFKTESLQLRRFIQKAEGEGN
jgi:hypothetical protein